MEREFRRKKHKKKDPVDSKTLLDGACVSAFLRKIIVVSPAGVDFLCEFSAVQKDSSSSDQGLFPEFLPAMCS